MFAAVRAADSTRAKISFPLRVRRMFPRLVCRTARTRPSDSPPDASKNTHKDARSSKGGSRSHAARTITTPVSARSMPVPIRICERSMLRFKFVPHSPDGLYEAGPHGLGLNLLPQAANVDRDRAWVPSERVIPYVVHQLFPAEHLTRARGQEAEEVELSRRELDRCSSRLNTSCLRLYGKPAEAKPFPGRTRSLRGGRAAEDSLDAGHKLPRAKWLDHVVVCTKFQADDAVRLLATRRDHNDGNRTLPSQRAADLQPIGSR